MRLSIKVIPNAKNTEIVKYGKESMTVRVSAPPEKGKANIVLLGFLQDYFGKKVRLVSGAASRKKVVEIEG